jgi:hypothetical protein
MDGALPAVGAAGAVSLRLTVAATVLALVTRPRMSRIPRSALMPAVAFGAVLGVMNLTFYLSLTRLPLGPAVTVEFMGPLLLAVARSRRPSDVAWAAVAGLGVIVVAWTRGGTAESLDPIGVLLALAAGAAVGDLHRAEQTGRSVTARPHGSLHRLGGRRRPRHPGRYRRSRIRPRVAARAGHGASPSDCCPLRCPGAWRCSLCSGRCTPCCARMGRVRRTASSR